jgi:hypothetical protein
MHRCCGRDELADMAALRSRAENLASELAMQQSRADELERVHGPLLGPACRDYLAVQVHARGG